MRAGKNNTRAIRGAQIAPSRNSPPALASARMSHLSLSMPGDRDAGGPRPGNDVIVLP